MRGFPALLCLGALCLGALHVSCSLPTPAELTASLGDRYPYDLLKNPCNMKHQYKDIDWYQRMWPLKTRQRTVLDIEALSLITDSVAPVRQVWRILLDTLHCSSLPFAPHFLQHNCHTIPDGSTVLGAQSKRPTPEQAERHRVNMRRVLAHNTTLPEDALRRSVVHNGDPERLQKLFGKVLAGAGPPKMPVPCSAQ